MAPSQHRAGRNRFTLRIPTELFVKFQKYADALGMSMTDILISYIVKATADVELTEQDYEQLIQQLRERNS